MLSQNIFGASGNEFLGWVQFARFAENQNPESGIRNPEKAFAKRRMTLKFSD